MLLIPLVFLLLVGEQAVGALVTETTSVQVCFGALVWVPSTDSPDKLVSASHSELVGVGWVHVDGVQTHFLLLFLCHNQFPLRDEKK